ncbi:ABC transporter permease [Streptomyces sp. NPDC006458]|uniref:ABC transporter permease n=1 Tax=Streptomyces sp. NPDC006458 TaxID=3154302 RepID=UPI0033A9712C
MPRFLLRRLRGSLLVLLGVSAITFVLARVIPSNPALTYVGAKATPEEVERVTHVLGLDQPLPVQYLSYLRNVLTGDWGTSIATKQPVLGELGDRLPATLELVGAAMAVALVLGITLGCIAAVRPGRLIDQAVRLLSIAGVSVPAFWLGLLLQLLVFGRLGLLPPTGRIDSDLEFTAPIHSITGLNTVDALLTGNGAALASASAHLILPALTLAAYPLGVVARMTRTSMLEALQQDHIRVGRAYGVPERTLVWRVALRNALPPTVTVLGLTAAYALTGAFFVEVVFDWPGLGQYAASGLLSLDYPAVMGVTLIGAIAYVLVNLAVDLVHARLDPRVRPA